jgi:hypothetical protein
MRNITNAQVFDFFGADDPDRTDDLRFTIPLLYQLSYVGVFSRI